MYLESESDLTLTLILTLTNYFRFQYTFIPAMDHAIDYVCYIYVLHVQQTLIGSGRLPISNLLHVVTGAYQHNIQ